jgi:phenylacetaldehyde dehydrogenase
MVAFTGSTEVGKLIIGAARGNLKKVTLELGGKSPNIVFADSDLASSIPGSAEAIFSNSGQVCVAGSRLFVEKGIFDDVVGGISDIAKTVRVGPGLDSDTQMGPLVSQEQLTRVTGYLESGRSDGAHTVTGGKRTGDKGYFVEPTVLVDTTPEMKIMREEIFGPVVAATPFSSAEEVIAYANDTTYGLAASIWTKDVKKAHNFARRVKAGTVCVNCWGEGDTSTPFGGYKQSGWGRENGREGIEEYTQIKTVVMKN